VHLEFEWSEGVPNQLGSGQANGALEEHAVCCFRREMAIASPLPRNRVRTLTKPRTHGSYKQENSLKNQVLK
jgi:hypothetical protein